MVKKRLDPDGLFSNEWADGLLGICGCVGALFLVVPEGAAGGEAAHGFAVR